LAGEALLEQEVHDDERPNQLDGGSVRELPLP
jgi:hypothetical protein